MGNKSWYPDAYICNDQVCWASLHQERDTPCKHWDCRGRSCQGCTSSSSSCSSFWCSFPPLSWCSSSSSYWCLSSSWCSSSSSSWCSSSSSFLCLCPCSCFYSGSYSSSFTLSCLRTALMILPSLLWSCLSLYSSSLRSSHFHNFHHFDFGERPHWIRIITFFIRASSFISMIVHQQNERQLWPSRRYFINICKIFAGSPFSRCQILSINCHFCETAHLVFASLKVLKNPKIF